MKMIWQLFGAHIVLMSIVLGLFLLWLVWPRRHKIWRRRMIKSSGLALLISILLGLYTYWPRAYEKKYLSSTVSTEIKQTPLRTLADSIGFYIGMATSSESPYLVKIANEFNSIVAENEFKPNQLLTDPDKWEYNFSKADKLMDFAQSKGLRVRGHTLIWGKFPGMTMPSQWVDQVKEASDKKKVMGDIITRYVRDVMLHFKGQVATWDIVNEPMGGETLYPSVFSETLGEEYIDLAFLTAHEVDPDCLLYLNEAIGDYEGPSGKAFLALLQRLISRDVPIHGVGLQTHHLFDTHDTEALRRYINEIEKMGLEVEITELDVRLLLYGKDDDPYQSQGHQFKKIVEICTQSPACKGVTLWGLTDKNNWMDAVPPFKWKSPNAPNIYDEDMNRKPGYIGIWEALSAAHYD